MVTSDVPGSSRMPRARNCLGTHPGDHGQVREGLGVVHERSPSCDAAAGFPCRAGTTAVTASLTQPTRADSSPATKRSGGRTNGSVAGAQRAAVRSAMARTTAEATCSRPSGTQTVIRAERRLAAANELGPVEHQVRGPEQQELVLVAGRLALHGVDHHGPTRTGEQAVASFMAAGNPAPPRPVRPDSSTTDMNLDRQSSSPDVATAPVRGQPGARRDRPDSPEAGTGRWWGRLRKG